MKIVVASGKGGTGKTTVAVSLALSLDFEKIQKIYPSKSFEELAREKRYQFFDAILNIYKINKVNKKIKILRFPNFIFFHIFF